MKNKRHAVLRRSCFWARLPTHFAKKVPYHDGMSPTYGAMTDDKLGKEFQKESSLKKLNSIRKVMISMNEFGSVCNSVGYDGGTHPNTKGEASD